MDQIVFSCPDCKEPLAILRANCVTQISRVGGGSGPTVDVVVNHSAVLDLSAGVRFLLGCPKCGEDKFIAQQAIPPTASVQRAPASSPPPRPASSPSPGAVIPPDASYVEPPQRGDLNRGL